MVLRSPLVTSLWVLQHKITACIVAHLVTHHMFWRPIAGPGCGQHGSLFEKSRPPLFVLSLAKSPQKKPERHSPGTMRGETSSSRKPASQHVASRRGGIELKKVELMVRKQKDSVQAHRHRAKCRTWADQAATTHPSSTATVARESPTLIPLQNASSRPARTNPFAHHLLDT